MAASVVLLCVMISSVWAADSGSTPGCSFVGGQCMYTVQLGHQGQCDAQPTTVVTSGDTKCCDDVKGDIVWLKAELESIQAQVLTLTVALNTTNQNLLDANIEVQTVKGERDTLLEMLHRKEHELNQTQTEVARILGVASKEIEALRADVTNLTNALRTCRAALGITSTEDGTSASLSGDVNLWYCAFNALEDCGYKHLTGTASFSLEHAGHSSQTGPRSDHTTGTPSGTYISVESSREWTMFSSDVMRQATIESELFQPANAYCVMFWYSMRGVDVVRLDVNIRIGGGTGYPVWTKEGDQKTDWLLGQVDLDSEYTVYPFKVDFVAYTNVYRVYNYHASDNYDYYKEAADIGIDDVYVYNTTCANIPKCPASSVKHTINNVTSCYTFHATPMTWKAAYEFCRRESPYSGLVSIETQQEQDYLVSVITNDPALTAVGQHGFYTSGSDAAIEHQFVWTDTGSARAITWAGVWHAGQPNNVGDNQNCLLMEYPSDGYTWGDIECDSNHPFICEVYY